MSPIFRISVILFLSALIPSLGHTEPAYKTCGNALNKRLTRVCNGRDSHSNKSWSLNNYEQISVNQSNFVSENGSANQMSRELVADCCTKTQGCSDGWIRQRYCSHVMRFKRDDSIWSDFDFANQWEYDCFQTSTFYYDWWRNDSSDVVAEHQAKDPLDCYKFCREDHRCQLFSFTLIVNTFVKANSCMLQSSTGGGSMRWLYSTSGLWDCDLQAKLLLKAPIDTCMEFANQNTQFLRKPKDYDFPSILLFVPRLDVPQQLNILTIKLKVSKKFTLFIAGEVTEGKTDDITTKGIDPNTLFNNAFAIDTRFTDSSPHVVANYKTAGSWGTDEQIFPFDQDVSKGTIDEIQIWFLPAHIETYIHAVHPDGTFEITSTQVDKPAWFDTADNIWFTGDADTKVFNLFHCTSGVAVPLSAESGYQLELPNMKAGKMLVNYIVFYGIAYGTKDGNFQIDFLANEEPNYDTVFSFSVRFSQGIIVYSAKINGSYDYSEEQVLYDFPFDTGPFGNNNFTRLEFMFRKDRINVAVNGFKYYPFKYRTYKSQDTVAARLTHVDWNDKVSEIQFVVFGIDAKFIDNF